MPEPTKRLSTLSWSELAAASWSWSLLRPVAAGARRPRTSSGSLPSLKPARRRGSSASRPRVLGSDGGCGCLAQLLPSLLLAPSRPPRAPLGVRLFRPRLPFPTSWLLARRGETAARARRLSLLALLAPLPLLFLLAVDCRVLPWVGFLFVRATCVALRARAPPLLSSRPPAVVRPPSRFNPCPLPSLSAPSPFAPRLLVGRVVRPFCA